MTPPHKLEQGPRRLRLQGLRGFTAALLGFTLAALSPGASAMAGPQPEFVTLGTGGGPRIHLERSQPANAVVVDDAVYLFDVGDGVQRQMRAAGLPLDRVRAVFISHHHLDHNAGLGPLMMNRWLQGIYRRVPVIGPPGTATMVTGLATAFQPMIAAPITIGGPVKPFVLDSLDAQDLPLDTDAPRVVYEDDKIRVLAITNNHYNFAPGDTAQKDVRSYSFRIESRGRAIVYSGDTGPSANLERIAQGADLLVSEVIDLPRELEALKRSTIPADMQGGLAEHMRLDHLTPAQIGKIAADAGVSVLVLTHLVPSVDGDRDLRGFTDGLREHFKGTVHIAEDLDRF